ncbi:MAG: AAA family ATPase [Chitinispirillales bacterium]|nr:AAA family ATPase [Chitinispirillales bacterium]
MNTSTQIAFEWATFYVEFADKLLSYKNNRTDLLTILKAAHEQAGLRCQFADFTDIDPFTVFGAFNKGITNANRMALLKALAERMDIKANQPVNFDGIPVLMNMMAIVAWNTEDFSDVWELFAAAISYADNPTNNNRNSFIKWYDTVTKHKGISWNVTMGLYWTRPYFYLNLDGTNRSFLLNGNDTRSIGIGSVSKLKRVPDAETYLNLIEVCQKSFSDGSTIFHSFPELSSAAWLAATSNSQEQDTKLSEASFLQWFEPLIEALKDLDGSASPDAVRKQIITNLNLPDEIINETRGKTGVKKFDNEVAFARNYLAYEGIIDKTVHGVWALTDKGKSITMTHELASEIFYRWVNILKERRENASDIETAKRETNEKRYWIYAPGENSRKWDEFYSQGIMGIGWDELGDLSEYPDREAMRTKMQEVYDKTKSHKNGSLATWQFVHTMRVGDIVFAKKGMREIVGRGIVESDYIFMPDRGEYKHIRKIRWTNNGRWEHPGQAVMKTLTDITTYTEYVQKLELLVVGDSIADDFEPEDEIKYEEYSDDDFLSEVFIDLEQYETLVSLLKNKKNLILQGVPGVGKTFAAKRLAYSIIGVKDTSRVMTVQFHQSYSYEDFIMGFRPTKDGFELAKGPFYTFCKDAQDDLERDYFFIIDEINRGNLSKIFGELLMLIENDKRGEKLRLLYSNELFSVPRNVHIIGLMNTADRSLAMIDYALRRRFAFYEMEPAFDSSGFLAMIERSNHNKFASLIERVKELNEAISKDESLGDGFRIGHSYFCTDGEITDYWLSSVINFEILPLLNEYWFDEKTKIESWVKKLRGVLND